MSDTNERSVASAGSHGDAVRSAALALYEAGRWVSVDVPREKADAMWATLRDALGLRPGHATARGVDGGGTKPTLTDEEREAIERLCEAVTEYSDIDRKENGCHADDDMAAVAVARGLMKRMV
jgi:hypothetical protein